MINSAVFCSQPIFTVSGSLYILVAHPRFCSWMKEILANKNNTGSCLFCMKVFFKKIEQQIGHKFSYLQTSNFWPFDNSVIWKVTYSDRKITQLYIALYNTVVTTTFRSVEILIITGCFEKLYASAESRKSTKRVPKKYLDFTQISTGA